MNIITNRNKSYMKYFAGLLLFGSNGIVAGQIDMPSASIVFFRTGIGAAILIALYFALQGRHRTHAHHNKHFQHNVPSQHNAPLLPQIPENKKHLFFNVLSGFAMGISWLFLYEGFSRVGVGLSTILYYCGPALVIVLSPLFFNERLTKGKVVCFSTVLAGMLLANLHQLGSGSDLTGIICGIMSAAFFSIMLITNKKAETIKGLGNSILQLAGAFAVTAVYILFKGGLILPATAQEFTWLLILGGFNTALGIYLYFSSMDDLSIQTVSVCGYLEPLSAIILSLIILGEAVLPLQIAGMFMIISGALLMEISPALLLRFSNPSRQDYVCSMINNNYKSRS